MQYKQDILDGPINIFNGVLDKDCTNVVKTSTVLKAIKDGKWSELIEYIRTTDDSKGREEAKKKLPGVTFSGVFEDRRLDKNIVHYNGILVIDIDLKDMNMTYEKTLSCLKSTAFIFCCFKSPSGGIKALTCCDIQPENHKAFFRGVEEYLSEEFGIKMDASGKNPGRLCFVSYDPDMYLDFENKELFDIEKFAPKTFTTEKSKQFEDVSTFDMSAYEQIFDARYVLDIAKERATKGVGSYHKGNRNNYIFYLSCILNRAGVPIDATIDIIFGSYPSLGIDEVKNTVSSAYRHNKNEFGTRPIMRKINSNQTKMI